MKETKKQYWKGLEELTKNPEFEKNAEKEFPEYLPINGESEGTGASRRDFLKLMGFGVAAASLAACETPVRKAIPYLNKPADVDPGIPNYYATTYVNGNDYCSVVVKTREGRPIKVAGNKLSSVSGGGTSSQVEASVLSLYDKERLKGPELDGKSVSWADLDKEVAKQLASAGKIALISNSVFSPSTLAAIDQLKSKYAGIEHIQYDQVSFSGILSANEKSFGSRVVPSYDFSKADTIVSFDADFLGNWLNHTLHSKQFAQTRRLSDKKKTMSRLYSFESNLSLTGSNADYRSGIKPSEQATYVANLYNLIAAKAGASKVSAPKLADTAVLTKAANDLWASKEKSLVVSGSNDENVQVIINAINNLLGCYSSTIDLAASVNTRKGNDTQMVNFIKSLNAGNYGGVLFFNCNPVYDHALGSKLAEGLKKAKFTLSTSDRKDETTSLVKALAPDSHYLESWNDFEAVAGKFSFSQPTISPLFDTRQAGESFLAWAGNSTSYYDFLKNKWSAGQSGDAQGFWDKTLQDGVIENTIEASAATFSADLNAAAKGLSTTGSDIELVVYENYSVGNGTQANNPWLQEMPDPITKAVWDNYLTISPAMANELGLELGDMKTQLVTLTVGNQTVKLPALVQPGQAKGTVGVAIGFGRTKAGKVANGVGVNAYPLISYKSGAQNLNVTSGVKVEMSGEEYRIAQTQTHQTYMGRENVIQESILSKYQKDASAGRSQPMISTYSGKEKPGAISLWSGHEYPNHHWGMTIDLNSCTGCGACTVSCQAENNVPVVGKEEVLNRREMTWLRIDRYYSFDEEIVDSKGGALAKNAAMEVAAAENPEVTFQPMMCQQCNNAPCETVCPVAATNHSTEGLNQMAYNRCIGTRYCANNCPYKVRRFNWFKYHDNDQFAENTSMNNDLGKMVLNPDVTVRSRGVMEKCSFCVQRIQAGKLGAKMEGRRPVDGEITSACAASCPSEAIVFGDMKDPNSRISQMLKLEEGENGPEVKEPRAYHVLEELSVKPNVWYFTKIRNKENEKQG
ncbi:MULTISPECIES: TAT-variant-translocated molybdopterin oxidoreductase [Reichenbachiella]|uniref:Prokaryotic molybdopterin-containing oxidoreductase family, iron-sulfur binding subunit n=1 Tax=Reichenbachiella agariperforans TaxID=156994 RepID=A0A1M6RGK5_REIAG|nr:MULTISPECIES: TAT-variant-translocated molybdopterin oxidoreductase [Reichenbachiella]MBU2915332.1 TAT-variant-translocated molybdopterin oxidoreductase [Reichenbachiella agariperforans]RJE70554.1 molybdopterin oxidoreductase [Reichenbachiella sp. MSK19-1]SHK31518.1 prokaryotic molybdopterin-containing oxidoreductase family, iron-sulfur binding subunit [Reichenbachiella agariperforans]